MGSNRRKASALPLVGLSLALLLVPSGYSQPVRLSLLSVFRPFEWLAGASMGLFGHVLPSGEVRELRAKLEFSLDQNQKLQNEIDLLKQKLEQASGTRQLLREPSVRLLHADVVLPADGSPWRKSLTLALGQRGGVQKGMLVLYNNQLVGRIAEVGPWSSRVQVVTDPGFRAGAVVPPRSTGSGVTFDKRHVGLYEGTSGPNGQVKWIQGDTPVENGAFVLTTEDPLNGIPRGIILGRVSGLSTGRGIGPKIDVEPVLNFRALEHVVVLVVPEDRR
jgi:rod shape-determining protein MreC